MINSITKFLKKNKTISQFKLEFPSSDFIPYACHIDDKTILCKNGHIFQVIKITGISDQLENQDEKYIRDKIRKTIIENVNNTNISIWFHTIRTKRNIDPAIPGYSNKFTKFVHEFWNKKNFWHDKFINEIYISLVYGGINFNFKNSKDIVLSLNADQLYKAHEKHITKALKELTQVVDSVNSQLSVCGSEILKIINHDESVRSEVMEFLSKIINLKHQDLPLPIVDISKYLVNHKLAFGNTSFEVFGNQSKHFGAILVLKDYHEINQKALNKIMLLPTQMVITQTMSFVDIKKAKSRYNNQDYILDVSLDADIRKFSGLDKIVNDKDSHFINTQISIMISADNQEILNNVLEKCVREIQSVGYVVIREDINLENIFWSQLPANFHFVNRNFPIPLSQVGGFVSINNYPAGHNTGIWEKAVTIFRTRFSTPYFFNYHNLTGNGNTIVTGGKNFKTLLMNFLVIESLKYSPQIIYITSNNQSDSLLNILHAINININEQGYDINNQHFVKVGIENIKLEQLRIFISQIIKSNNFNKKIIVLDEIGEIAKKLNCSLKDLSTIISLANSNNIFLCNYNLSHKEEIASLMYNFGTKIFTPTLEDNELAIIKNILSINEIDAVKSLSELSKEFLIKQDKDNIIAELNITGAEDIIAILTNQNAKIDKFLES